MHRSGAQLACRLGFVLLCLLPTVAMVSWIVVRSSPGYVLSQRQEWERELSRRIGMRVTIKAVEYPRPDTAELTNVIVSDLETNTPLATLATLEVIRSSDRWKFIGWQAVLQANQLAAVQERVEQNLFRLPSSDVVRCEVCLRELTLQSGNQGFTLLDVTASWQPDKADLRADLRFRLPEADQNAAPVSFLVTRNRGMIPPATRWQFDSGALPLPAALAGLILPEAYQLGNYATFAGRADLVQVASQLSGSLQGVLHDVEMSAVASERLPNQLSSLATCKIEEAQVQNGSLIGIRGLLQSRDGLVSNSLSTQNFARWLPAATSQSTSTARRAVNLGPAQTTGPAVTQPR